MKLEINYSYAEVLEVLEYMDEKYLKKIPKSLIDFFKDNSVQDYKKHINPYVKLKNQNLKRKTLAILALINYKYWNNYMNIDTFNIKNKLKYTDDIFKKSNIKENTTKEIHLVEKRKETIFEKIIKCLKRLKNKRGKIK